MPANVDPSRADQPSLPGDNVRAGISLLLFIHLFIVLICLAANLVPSELEMRLLRMFQPYSQLLNFDLDGTRYYLTHATEQDVDHRWEVLPVGDGTGGDQGWQVLRNGIRGGERYGRYQRFADAMAFSADNDELTSLLAESVGRHYLRQAQVPIGEVRCRRHALRAFATAKAEEVADWDDPAYFADMYRAQIVATQNGPIGVLKREAAALEAAVKNGQPEP